LKPAPPPLKSIVVVDFSRVLAGPLCTQMLGDAGAEIIKVEEPGRGDETRRWGPPFLNGVSAYFLAVNRNKKSITLDLRRGGEVTRRLVEHADVVVDNFLPSQRRRFGLEGLRKINPRVVHCSIAGFDSDTAHADTPGYDLLAQAETGLISITGEPGRDPVKVGVAMADVLTAHYAHGAICASLFARERTGRGDRIEISLYAAMTASLINVAQSALITGREAAPHGAAHPSIVPYQTFHASDRLFAIGAGTDRHFQLLCDRVIGQPRLAEDERFATNAARVANRKRLLPMLEKIFRTRPAAEWVRVCRAAGVPSAIVQGVGEALRSDHGRKLVASVNHRVAGTYETMRSPVVRSGKRSRAGSAPPELGQHTREVLRTIGYGRREIDALKGEGVV
jgi:crotonobetainyl-CoA:carnitine CoA-transferase CaiB-like acyl-CoA transferase